MAGRSPTASPPRPPRRLRGPSTPRPWEPTWRSAPPCWPRPCDDADRGLPAGPIAAPRRTPPRYLGHHDRPVPGGMSLEAGLPALFLLTGFYYGLASLIVLAACLLLRLELPGRGDPRMRGPARLAPARADSRDGTASYRMASFREARRSSIACNRGVPSSPASRTAAPRLRRAAGHRGRRRSRARLAHRLGGVGVCQDRGQAVADVVGLRAGLRQEPAPRPGSPRSRPRRCARPGRRGPAAEPGSRPGRQRDQGRPPPAGPSGPGRGPAAGRRCPPRRAGPAPDRRRVPRHVVALLPDRAARRSPGAPGSPPGLRPPPRAGSGRRGARSRRISAPIAVPADEPGQAELPRQVGFLRQVRPGGARRLGRVDRRQGIEGRPADLEVRRVDHPGEDGDQPRSRATAQATARAMATGREVEVATGDVEQGGRRDGARQLADQADVGGDAQPGAVLDGQAGEEPTGGLGRVDRRHERRPAACCTASGRRAAGRRAHDHVRLRVGRRQLAHRASLRGPLRERRDRTGEREPGLGPSPIADRPCPSRQGIDQRDPLGDVGTGTGQRESGRASGVGDATPTREVGRAVAQGRVGHRPPRRAGAPPEVVGLQHRGQGPAPWPPS